MKRWIALGYRNAAGWTRTYTETIELGAESLGRVEVRAFPWLRHRGGRPQSAGGQWLGQRDFAPKVSRSSFAATLSDRSSRRSR